MCSILCKKKTKTKLAGALSLKCFASQQCLAMTYFSRLLLCFQTVQIYFLLFYSFDYRPTILMMLAYRLPKRLVFCRELLNLLTFSQLSLIILCLSIILTSWKMEKFSFHSSLSPAHPLLPGCLAIRISTKFFYFILLMLFSLFSVFYLLFSHHHLPFTSIPYPPTA